MTWCQLRKGEKKKKACAGLVASGHQRIWICLSVFCGLELIGIGQG